MRNQRQRNTAHVTAARGEFQIATLIATLTRSITILSIDIEHEEDRAQVHNVLDAAYPMLARTLRARRDNLVATIAALETLVNTGDLG